MTNPHTQRNWWLYRPGHRIATASDYWWRAPMPKKLVAISAGSWDCSCIRLLMTSPQAQKIWFPRGSCLSGGFPRGNCPIGGFPHGKCLIAGFPHGNCPSAGFPHGNCPSGGFPHGNCPNDLLVLAFLTRGYLMGNPGFINLDWSFEHKNMPGRIILCSHWIFIIFVLKVSKPPH